MGKVIKFGTIAIDDGFLVKTLSSNGEADKYSSFELPLDTYYQVPAGYKIECGLILYSAETAKGKICFGYGDTAIGESSAPPTNFIGLVEALPVEVADRLFEVEIFFYVPANKYPCAHFIGGAGNCRIICHEVEV
jgi:hypothetical protein